MQVRRFPDHAAPPRVHFFRRATNPTQKQKKKQRNEAKMVPGLMSSSCLRGGELSWNSPTPNAPSMADRHGAMETNPETRRREQERARKGRRRRRRWRRGAGQGAREDQMPSARPRDHICTSHFPPPVPHPPPPGADGCRGAETKTRRPDPLGCYVKPQTNASQK